MSSSKKNAILGTWELDIDSNYHSWQDLDLGAYTGNKLGKALLHCEVLSGDGDLSEFVTLKFKPKGLNVKPESTTFRYGEEIGVSEIWTDDDGVIQWWSEYGCPETKTLIIQIKIMIAMD